MTQEVFLRMTRQKIRIWALVVWVFILSAVAGSISFPDLFKRFSFPQSIGAQDLVFPVQDEAAHNAAAKAFSNEFSSMSRANRLQKAENVVFIGGGGTERTLLDYDGRYVLLNLWASWCSPCIRELPSLGALQEKYEPLGLSVIAVSLDRNKNIDNLKAFLDSRGIGDFALYHDHLNQVSRAFPARGIPTSFLIGPQGHILYVFEGDANWISPEAQMFFDSFLKPNQE